MDEIEMVECERCGVDEYPDNIETIELMDEWNLCYGCRLALNEDIEYYDWRNRYTEEQHERALDIINEYDEIECCIESYEDGQLILHTPYVTGDVVGDLCNHFNYEIKSYGPVWVEEDDSWPCMEDHGSIFQIMLEYNESCNSPVPIGAKFYSFYMDDLSEHDKQF